jgi:hypothetical protein
MNFKKTTLYLLLSIFLLIFLYNYVLPYFMVPNTTGMRMGMHMREGLNNNNIYYYNNFSTIIIVIVIVLVGFMLLDKIIFSSHSNNCKNCGLPIESETWKICPRCGSRLQDKRGNNS